MGRWRLYRSQQQAWCSSGDGRKDRLDQLVDELENAGDTALSIEADITDRSQAAAAVQQAVEQFGGSAC
jgi:NADP-dependent 3-hydroxy acid dehydrogenase YdfG